MKLVAWNSFGAKWDIFWSNWITPIVPGTGANTDDVAGVLLEAGWAPWVQSTGVSINGLYQMDETKEWFDGTTAAASSFCQGVLRKRRFGALWVPWAKTLAEVTNSRCSLGATALPSYLSFWGFSRIAAGLERPVVKMQFAEARSVVLTILSVHLKANTYSAQQELNYLTSVMRTLIPQGTAGLVVGDLNVDLLTVPYVPDPDWYVLRTGVATQQKGGELDWALLYDPNNQYNQTATATVLQQYKSGANTSDHSVLQYYIDI
jgi:hypothetical protein